MAHMSRREYRMKKSTAKPAQIVRGLIILRKEQLHAKNFVAEKLTILSRLLIKMSQMHQEKITIMLN